MRVLLVEPDRVLGQTAKSALESLGCEVAWNKTAQSALDSMDDSIPDLIVLEIQLGTHNGVELLYELASYSEWQNIPIIIHTINEKVQREEFSDALNQLKVRQVLYKPATTTASLVNVVKQFA